jgi:hypothetical protein
MQAPGRLLSDYALNVALGRKCMNRAAASTTRISSVSVVEIRFATVRARPLADIRDFGINFLLVEVLQPRPYQIDGRFSPIAYDNRYWLHWHRVSESGRRWNVC